MIIVLCNASCTWNGSFINLKGSLLMKDLDKIDKINVKCLSIKLMFYRVQRLKIERH